MVGSVYVIKAGDAYKIGFTGKSVGDRVKQLQIGNPNKMKLVPRLRVTWRLETA